MGGMSTTAEVAVVRAESCPRIVAFVSLCFLGATAAAGQSPGQVRLTMLEASARTEARSCTLEVMVGQAAGEAILTCDRHTPPVSHLAAHRALTTSEVSRLYELASVPVASRPQSSENAAPANIDRAKATITIARGTDRVVLDATDGPNGLSGQEQQIWRLLRGIADDLRGTGRR